MPARPALDHVEHGTEAWDSVINDDLDKLGLKPAPLVYYASEAALIADADPAAYLGCVAAVTNTETTTLYVSNGVAWKPLATRAAATADSAGASLAGLTADFNAFLSTLRTAGVIHT